MCESGWNQDYIPACTQVAATSSRQKNFFFIMRKGSDIINRKLTRKSHSPHNGSSLQSLATCKSQILHVRWHPERQTPGLWVNGPLETFASSRTKCWSKSQPQEYILQRTLEETEAGEQRKSTHKTQCTTEHFRDSYTWQEAWHQNQTKKSL